MNHMNIFNAVKKRADWYGEAYFEDYGSSIWRTAKTTKLEAIEAVNDLERLGILKVVRIYGGCPVKLKIAENILSLDALIDFDTRKRRETVIKL